MWKRIIITLTILTLNFVLVHGQSYKPMDLAKQIFGKDNFSNINTYITGDYYGRPNGQDLQKGSTTKFKILEQKENTAVIGMTILDSLGEGVDTYLHFKKDTMWKMSAFRSLAMTSLINQIKIELEKLTPQKIDEIITNYNNDNKNYLVKFESREEYNFLLGNAKLTLELDDNIANHFKKNQEEFERLKNLALKQLEKEKFDKKGSIELLKKYKDEYKKLFIKKVSIGGHEIGNCINFFISGTLDNKVGYIYVGDKKDLPEMDPSGIIMIREIGDGWYIYKTT